MNLNDPKELLYFARRKPRLWYYTKESRKPDPELPEWRSPRLPWFGDDEFGRKTIVIPIPFAGEIVFAFWTWTDEEADQMRKQTFGYTPEDDKL